MNETTSPPPPHARQVAINLVLIVVALALISGWLLYYTDWFPLVGGFFTLSGVFAWLAFVSNLLTSERSEQIQQAFDTHVLQSSATPIIIVSGMTLLAAGLWASRGTLVLDGLQDAKGRSVELYEVTKEGKRGAVIERFALAGAGQAKVSLWTGLLGKREVLVEPAGLPWLRLRLSAADRNILRVPKSFEERAVLLVRPRAINLATLARAPERFRLVITVGGAEPYMITPYGGEAVLIGAPAGLVLPESLIESWRLAFQEAGRPPATARAWMQPRAEDPDFALPANAEVTARLDLVSNPGTLPTVRARISPLGTASTYPLELVVEK